MYYDKIYTMHKKGRRIILHFYQRLKDLREDHDLTQADVAKIIGTSQRQYCRWEMGQWQMPIEHYKTLARYYEVSLDYLAGLISKPTAPGGGPYKVSKNYNINQNGNITNNFN